MEPISHKPSFTRTLLILGRISNLPTVWSNCIAGWLLGGAGDARVLGLVCVAASFLYVAGMFLNDACDSRFDARHRSGRPIPSGAIKAPTVLAIGILLLALGVFLCVVAGRDTGWIGMGLAACIVLYNVVHKHTRLAPVLMAGCRFLLYLVAASAGTNGISQQVLWCGLALAFYIIGLSWIARRESTGARINYWALMPLGAPFIIVFVVNELSLKLVLLASVFLAWLAWCVSLLLPSRRASSGLLNPAAISRAVAGLLAGIVLLDLLLAQPAGAFAFVLPVLFVSALLLQRTIPAT